MKKHPRRAASPAPVFDALTRYRQKLIIDKHDLDTMVSEQPSLFLEVSEAFTIAASHRDAADNEADQLAARLGKSIRAKASASGERITNDEVNSKVATNSKYIAAREEFHRRKLEADKLFHLKEAFMQRGYMLRELCHLYSSGYWSNNTMTGGSNALANANIARVKDSMRSKRQK